MSIKKCKGVNGVLEVHEDKVTITYSVFLGGNKGTREIPMDSIKGVQFKKPGLAVSGFIKLLLDGHEGMNAINTFDAADEDNTVLFTRKEYKHFFEAKELVENSLIQNEGQNNPEGEIKQSSAMVVSVSEEIRNLHALKEEGILTEEEFSAKKKQLLGI
ncbi:SHOCT domain-containing protein [Priestia megaterium]|uniref:SHOCT domain-containing protein n=1 Tax=Priestia megaterium TaxID=1404 RepID=UPI0025AF5EF7|nr:SHOCT domain-containing protein [Priestia megaterium]MDN3365425.1 SHOCT domain-containing protein [Priestia megaterium]